MSQSKPLHFRLCLASPGGFEPLTPRLGGECSIQLSYEDMSDFWLKIGLSATFQASGSVTGYSITYAFWMNCSIQLSSIHSPLVASYMTLTLTDSNYRVLFPIVQRRQASPFLRRLLSFSVKRAKHKCLVQELNPHGWLRRPLPSPLDERDISAQMDSNHPEKTTALSIRRTRHKCTDGFEPSCKELQSRLVPDHAHMSGQCSSRTNLFPSFNRTPLPFSQLSIIVTPTGIEPVFPN